MSLQTTTNINVDFYDKKYILINAKQFDKKSRFLSVTCYNRGETFHLNNGEHSAYIRYKKSDDNSVFNFCEINSKGKVIVELTEQMLASDGICYADLVIVNKGDAKVDSSTGEIIAIENTSVLSTMTFCIDVQETATENSNIESSYEFNGLNEALEKAEAEYEQVMKTAKSWAVGNTGIRSGENTDNSKYYANLASNNQKSAEASAKAAANSASAAALSEVNAASSETNASIYADRCESYAESASQSKSDAAVSEANAKNYADNAQSSMNSASSSETNASTSEINAKYYYEEISKIAAGLNGYILPAGTITYSELLTLATNGTVKAGFMYNISDDFITDETFVEGVGVEYPAGTNVFYTEDGYWDCLVGKGIVFTANVATVSEVTDYLGIV